MTARHPRLSAQQFRVSGERYEDIYKTVLNHLFYSPMHIAESRSGMMHESLNLQFMLTNPYDRLVWSSARDANYDFAMKMFIWILNGCDDAAYLMDVNPNAARYLDDSKEKSPNELTFVTAYGPRIKSQLPGVLQELRDYPDSRRASIMILRPEDEHYRGIPESKIEYPCAQSINFSIRDNHLHCTGIFRSNNMFTTVVYDVFVFTMLQEYVLNALNALRAEMVPSMDQVKMGTYTHHAISAHIFKSDEMRIRKAISAFSLPWMNRFDKKESNGKG